jgi:hypothetical protein
VRGLKTFPAILSWWTCSRVQIALTKVIHPPRPDLSVTFVKRREGPPFVQCRWGVVAQQSAATGCQDYWHVDISVWGCACVVLARSSLPVIAPSWVLVADTVVN